MAQICDHCKRIFTPRPKIVVVSHRRGALARRIINPIDIAAVEATDRGIVYHLCDEDQVFAYDTLKAKLQAYPDLFMRVRNDWIVRPDLVVNAFKDGSKYFLRVESVDCPIPVAQKTWKSCAVALGVM